MMRLLSLDTKKKLSRRLNRLRGGVAMLVLGGSYLLGVAGMFTLPYMGSSSGSKEEVVVLQQQVDHLLTTYRLSQSMDMVVKAAEPDKTFGLDIPAAMQKDATLKEAFEAQAQATGIALAHARHLSPDQRYELYHALDNIKPKPAYFPAHGESDADFLLYNHAQSRIMDRPGFQPGIKAAEELAAIPGNGTATVLGVMLGPFALSCAGVFGFCVARKRLDRSIDREQAEIAEAEEERQKAQARRQAEEAARLAAEEAERQRIASLPPSTRLERDIRVKQLKLAKPQALA